MRIIVLLISVGFLATQCRTGSGNDTLSLNDTFFRIDSNLASWRKGPQTFEVPEDKGGQFMAEDGTRILVPAGALVNKEGKAVSATLYFTPVRGAEEVIESGIPMQIINQGKRESFVSDGMFTIDAEANGERLQISPGKPIEVYQPSLDSKTAFQYWYFDKKKGAWQLTGQRDSLAESKEIDARAEKLGLAGKTKVVVAKPEPPKAYNPKKKVLDLQFDEANYPELSGYSRILWQFAGTDPKQDPQNNEWIFNEEWTRTDLTKATGSTYQLTIRMGEKTFATLVTPALAGKDLAKAMQRYNALLKSAEKERNEYVTQETQKKANLRLYNAFTVAQLGPYNCDRFYNDPEAQEYTVTAEFEKAQKTGQVFYAILDKKAGYLSYSTGAPVKIRPEVVDGVIAVMGKGVIAVATKESMNNLKNAQNKKVHLKFERIKGTRADLKKIIASM